MSCIIQCIRKQKRERKERRMDAKEKKREALILEIEGMIEDLKTSEKDATLKMNAAAEKARDATNEEDKLEAQRSQDRYRLEIVEFQHELDVLLTEISHLRTYKITEYMYEALKVCDRAQRSCY